MSFGEKFGEQLGEKLGETIAEGATPVATEAGKELADLLDLLFTPVKAAKIYQELWLDDFRERVLKKFCKIPLERITPPPLEIIGPTIEAGKFHMEREDMREMFANLVSHACDKQTRPSIHPSFVTILTQLTPLEAKILTKFRQPHELRLGLTIKEGDKVTHRSEDGTGTFTYPEVYLPTVNYNLAKGTEQQRLYSNIVLYEECQDGSLVEIAVSNLVRLGLIEVSYFKQKPESEYASFLTNNIYKDAVSRTSQGCQGASMFAFRGRLLFGGYYEEVKLDKGISVLTPLGFSFTRACVLEDELTTRKDAP